METADANRLCEGQAVKWSVWGDGDEFTLAPGGDQPVGDTPGLPLLVEFEAVSYEDALRQYYAWQGWGEYKPIGS